MLRRTNRLLIVATITVLLAALSMLGNAAAQKDSVPKPQDKLALGENDVKHLLPLMEADRHGKVSRQEYMKFMAAEFDRLDKAKSGELDVKVLTQSNWSISRFVGEGWLHQPNLQIHSPRCFCPTRADSSALKKTLAPSIESV